MGFENVPISLIARQDLKGRACSTACTIVLHSTTEFAAEAFHSAHNQEQSLIEIGRKGLLGALAELLSLPHQQLEAAVLHSKLVTWLQSQVVSPAELSEGHPSCMVAERAPNLILAGDYLSKLAGSFEGCLESAEAVAEEAYRALYAKESVKRLLPFCLKRRAHCIQ